MGGLKKERIIYAVLGALITGSVLLGFSNTYLPPASPAPDLPLSVHVHGIAFLAWYVLLLLQSLLVVAGKIAWHRTLGLVTCLLVAVMVASGWIVIAANMQSGLEGSVFWSSFALVILSNLILFTGYFIAAIRHRRNGALHRRLMIIAAATGSGAAQFRTLAAHFDLQLSAAPVGIAVTNLFIVIAILADRFILGRWHKVHFWGLGIAILLEAALLGLAFTDMGVSLQRFLVDISAPLLAFY